MPDQENRLRDRALGGAVPLDSIAGIGRKRSRWFARTYSARTVADVADLDPHDLEERLIAAGDPAGASAAPRWVAEARRLVTTTQQQGSAVAQDSDLDGATIASEPGWQPFAAFVVELQCIRRDGGLDIATFVHHLETDRTRAWRRLATDEAGAVLGIWAAEALDAVCCATEPEVSSNPSAARKPASGRAGDPSVRREPASQDERGFGG
jgi:hypothetical protein